MTLPERDVPAAGSDTGTAAVAASPRVTIVVPVYNAATMLARCLDAIDASSFADYELIVVSDASPDESANVARSRGAKVIELERQGGPGGARNAAAQQARGEVLFFVDSDVLVKPDTVARAVAALEDPAVGAVFGSYDDEPDQPGFFSQFKNLCHHFVHQEGSEDASTFWAGCGAVRRRAFLEVGGFDAVRYARPSIEDIELGWRLRRAGWRIVLDKGLQGKHLKRWTFAGILRTDIFDRAVPWTRLLLQNREVVADLNLKSSDRLSAGLTGLLVLTLAGSPFEPRLLIAAVVLVAALYALNRRLFGFLARRKGPLFLLGAVPMYLLYYFYSGIVFTLMWLRHRLAPARGERHDVSSE